MATLGPNVVKDVSFLVCKFEAVLVETHVDEKIKIHSWNMFILDVPVKS